MMDDPSSDSEKWARLRARTEYPQPRRGLEDQIELAWAQRENSWVFGITSLAAPALRVGMLLLALAVLFGAHSEQLWRQAIQAEQGIPDMLP